LTYRNATAKKTTVNSNITASCIASSSVQAGIAQASFNRRSEFALDYGDFIRVNLDERACSPAQERFWLVSGLSIEKIF
jgi:hypothetical protein